MSKKKLTAFQNIRLVGVHKEPTFGPSPCSARKPSYAELQADLDRLQEFARYVIRQECWSLSDLDGGDIQELAEKLNLIEPRIATENDVDDESDFDAGDRMFVFSDTLKEVKP